MLLCEPVVAVHEATQVAQVVPDMARESLSSASVSLSLVQELESAISTSIAAEETSAAEILKRRSSMFSFIDATQYVDPTIPVADASTRDSQAKQLAESLSLLIRNTAAAPDDAHSVLPSTQPDALNQILSNASASTPADDGSGPLSIAPVQTSRRSKRARPVKSSYTAKKAKEKTDSAIKTPGTSPTPSIPLPIPANGPLPIDHKPARGRGRAQQLQSMTKAQIDAEAIAMKEKNRMAARELRLKRKQREAELEARVRELEAKDIENQKLISSLQAKINYYEKLV